MSACSPGTSSAPAGVRRRGGEPSGGRRYDEVGAWLPPVWVPFPTHFPEWLCAHRHQAPDDATDLGTTESGKPGEVGGGEIAPYPENPGKGMKYDGVHLGQSSRCDLSAG